MSYFAGNNNELVELMQKMNDLQRIIIIHLTEITNIEVKEEEVENED